MSGHKYGRHSADEIVKQAGTVLQHIHETSIWSVMGSPNAGRMTEADVRRGRTLHRDAMAAQTTSTTAGTDITEETHVLDDAFTAAEAWLADQIIAVHGVTHESGDDDARDAFDAALSGGHAQATTVTKMNSFIALAKDPTKDDPDTSVRKLVREAYTDDKSRHAILKDGAHLAAELSENVGAPAAAIGARKKATSSKDDAIAQLTRWLHRWVTVARHHLSEPDLTTLGLASARHHPEHRPKHPAASAPPPPAVPPAPPAVQPA